MNLRTSSAEVEGPYQASKWLKYPILIDYKEMESLFNEMDPFLIYTSNKVVPIGDEQIKKEDFLELYREYVNSLKNGEIPEMAKFRSYFSSIFTKSSETLYGMLVGINQLLVKISKPVIQLQVHCMDYSEIDGKFRSMTFGSDNILWGIQFAYPQIYQDNQTNQVLQVKESVDFPNTLLFRRMQKWIRAQTQPTPFFVNGARINVPFRLGKECFAWINNHKQLQTKGIKVVA
jgi:hypothetical protein